MRGLSAPSSGRPCGTRQACSPRRWSRRHRAGGTAARLPAPAHRRRSRANRGGTPRSAAASRGRRRPTSMRAMILLVSALTHGGWVETPLPALSPARRRGSPACRRPRARTSTPQNAPYAASSSSSSASVKPSPVARYWPLSANPPASSSDFLACATGGGRAASLSLNPNRLPGLPSPGATSSPSRSSVSRPPAVVLAGSLPLPSASPTATLSPSPPEILERGLDVVAVRRADRAADVGDRRRCRCGLRPGRARESSAPQVIGPTMPSGSRPRARWNEPPPRASAGRTRRRSRATRRAN